jgi:hypothetical protein
VVRVRRVRSVEKTRFESFKMNISSRSTPTSFLDDMDDDAGDLLLRYGCLFCCTLENFTFFCFNHHRRLNDRDLEATPRQFNGSRVVLPQSSLVSFPSLEL